MSDLLNLLEFDISPGVYRGSRSHSKLPWYKHEFVMVAPRNPERLKKSTRRKLRVVNGRKVLVAGAYGETGGFMGIKGIPANKMRSRLADRLDVKRLKEGRAKLTKVSSRGSNKAARKVVKSSKAFKATRYPSLFENMKGKSNNSNTYARSLMNKLGHKAPRKRSFWTPGGDRRMKV